MATTYRKTPKGFAEVETRAHRLTPRVRNVLILLDGARTLEELRAMVSQGLDESLQVLLGGEFIEPALVPERQQAAVRVEPPPPPNAPEAPDADFLAVRREVVRIVNEQLGPVAETVAIKMERARSAAELRPLLATAAQLIRTVRGGPAAQAFRERFLAE
jgi:hypothetical protein